MIGRRGILQGTRLKERYSTERIEQTWLIKKYLLKTLMTIIYTHTWRQSSLRSRQISWLWEPIATARQRRATFASVHLHLEHWALLATAGHHHTLDPVHCHISKKKGGEPKWDSNPRLHTASPAYFSVERLPIGYP